jgi:hypothetical protein
MAEQYCMISWQCEWPENAVSDAAQSPGMSASTEGQIASSQCAAIMGCFTALEVKIWLNSIA